MADVHIELFGGLRVRVGDRTVPDRGWRRRKAAAVLKLLALAPGHRLHREQLMDALWPDLAPEPAAANLRKALHHARRALGPSGEAALSSQGEHVVLSGGSVTVDVDLFRATVDAARRQRSPDGYQRALDLYRNGLLPEDPYEEWAAAPRRELHTQMVDALEELIGLLEARGQLAEATAAARRFVALEPQREEGHVALVRLLALAGRWSDALDQYEQLASTLATHLGTEPGAEAQRLYEEIRTRQPLEPELDTELWERVGDLRLLAGDAVGAGQAFTRALGRGAPATTRLHRKCAEAWLLQHRPDQAEPHLAAAEGAAASDTAERGRLTRVRATHAWQAGDLAAAQHHAEQALETATRHGDADDLAAAHEVLAVVSHMRGNWRDGLGAELDRLAGGAEPGRGELARVFEIHHCIGQYHLYGDELSGSVEGYARHLVARADDAGARRAQAFAWCLLGESLLLGARWDEAEACLARSCDLHASLGSRSGALAWQRRAELAACRADHATVDDHLRQAVAIATVSPMARHLWGRIHATRALAALDQGDTGEAARSIGAAGAAAARYGDCPTCSALLNPVAAETFARTADPRRARAAAEAAEGVARMFASSAWRAMAASATAHAALAGGDADEARRQFAAAGEAYRRAGQPYWAERAAQQTSSA